MPESPFVRRWWLLSAITVIAILYVLVTGKPARLEGAWGWSIPYMALVIAGYLRVLHQVGEDLEPSPSFNVLLLFWVLFGSTLLLVGAFAVAWHQYFAYGAAGVPVTSPVDAFYFSATVLLTVGFGDYTPIGLASKLFMAFQAMVGMAHFVAFFAVGFNRLTASRAKPIVQADVCAAPSMR